MPASRRLWGSFVFCRSAGGLNLSRAERRALPPQAARRAKRLSPLRALFHRKADGAMCPFPGAVGALSFLPERRGLNLSRAKRRALPPQAARRAKRLLPLRERFFYRRADGTKRRLPPHAFFTARRTGQSAFCPSANAFFTAGQTGRCARFPAPSGLFRFCRSAGV